MVAKTPNKRKSLAAGGVKIEGTPAKSPQANPKTPQTGKKGKANQSLVESGKTPKKNQQNSEGTPQKNGFTPGKKQRKNSGSEKTPAAPKTPNQPASPQKQQNSPGQKRKSSVSEGDEGGKKPKIFPGTALNDSQTAKPSPKKEGKKKNKNKKTPQAPIPRGDKHRKTLFESVKEQIEKSGKESAIANLEKKITEMEKRKNPTKTTQKKLKQHQRVLKLVQEGDLNTLDARGKVVMPDKPAKVQEKDSESKKRRQRKNKAVNKAKENGKSKIPKTEPAKEAGSDEDDDDASEDESDYEVEATIKPDKIAKTMNEDNKDSDEEDDDDAEEAAEEKEDSDDAEEEESLPKPKQQQQTPKGQSRYILFVGNIAFDTNKNELIEHFNKVGKIVDVRIPTDKDSNKPRGFAYVEFENEETYQKALSLHHSYLKERRINVLYTQGGKKKGEDAKKEIKAKNFKLQAMRSKGQLTGSVKQENKRNFRRNKGKNFGGKGE